MRTATGYLTPLIAAAGIAAAILVAPTAAAEPTQPDDTTLPTCVDTGGAVSLGGSTTECVTPGDAQIDATPAEVYPYPWGDEFYGPGLLFGAL